MGFIPSQRFIRRNTAAMWTELNSVLSEGEFAIERDTGRVKIGDGVTAWTDLGYSFLGEAGDIEASILEHVNSETPHPVYDDGPSLFLLYENAKV